jgi:hypothetical protein
MWRYLLLWLPMLLLAVANGALRELTLRRRLGELRAHQLSTLLLLVLLALYIGGVLRVWPPTSPGEALAVGSLWLGLTLSFEFLAGRYLSKQSWRRLLADYDLRAGRLWALVPLWVLVAPLLFQRWQPYWQR